MEKRTIDWERIELDYRAGILTLREIASAHGVSHTSVKKRATRDGWDRNLTQRILEKADALVSKDQVSKVSKPTELETVQAAALAIAAVKMAHRKDTSKLREIVSGLIAELETYDDDLKIRLSCAKTATETMALLVRVESEAWNFAAQPAESPEDRPKMDPMERARRVAFMLRQAAESQPPAVH